MKSVGNEAFSIIDLDGIVQEQPTSNNNEDGKSEHNKKSETSELIKDSSKIVDGSIAEV